ncbi:hypothetical protein C815_02013 [Firmicutes bacterium M10-2]|nr:hypothetical protein C815_02013 [Firmicutes bacterium M10-2]
MELIKSRIFGYFVAAMRKKNKWSIESLAHSTNYSYSMIRSIEKGVSNLDEEDKNRFARLFGFSSFQSNINNHYDWDMQLNALENAQITLQKEKQNQILHSILENRSLIASFLFPQYILMMFYDRITNDGNEHEINELQHWIEQMTDFYSPKEKALFFDLLGIYATDLEKETAFFHTAYTYDPRSFLVNLHLAMNTYFHHRMMEASHYLEYCKSSLFQIGSIYRYIEISLLDAQLHIDLGNIDRAINTLINLLTNQDQMDLYLRRSCLSLLAFGYFRKNDIRRAMDVAFAAIDLGEAKPLLYVIILFAAFRLDDPRFDLFVIRAKDHLYDVQSFESTNSFDLLVPWNQIIDGIIAWKNRKFEMTIQCFESTLEPFAVDPLRPWILDCLVECARSSQNFELALYYQKEISSLLQNNSTL